MFDDITRKACVICGSEVTMGTCQSITAKTDWGDFTVCYHSSCCYDEERARVLIDKAINELVEEHRPKEDE